MDMKKILKVVAFLGCIFLMGYGVTKLAEKTDEYEY